MTFTSPDRSEPKPPDGRKYLVDTLEYAYGPLLVTSVYAVVLQLDPAQEVILGFTFDFANAVRLIFENQSREVLRGVFAPLIGIVFVWSFPIFLSQLVQIFCYAARDYKPTYRRQKFHEKADIWVVFLIHFAMWGSVGISAGRIAFNPESGGQFFDADVWLYATAVLMLFSLFAAGFWTYIRLSEVDASDAKQRRQAANTSAKVAAAKNSEKNMEAASSDQFRPANAPKLARPDDFSFPGVVKSTYQPQPTTALPKLKWDTLIQQFGHVVAPIVVSAFGIVFTVVAVFLASTADFFWSALGFTSLFLLIVAAALTAMTYFSAHNDHDSTPYIFGPLALTLLSDASGMGFAFIVAVLVLIIGLRIRFRHPTTVYWWTIAFGIFLVLGLKAIVPECRSLSGCNIVSGKVPQPRPWLDSDAVESADTVTAAFRLWEKPKDGAPIRIVAAQGGGIYAAYYTAAYLALRADTEGESFQDSLFAISGVSGGSIGAAVFWAIQETGICDPVIHDDLPESCHVAAVNEILRQDYLSPQFIRFFSLDALDSIFPISAIWPEPIDRAKRLESVLARNVDQCCGFHEEPGSQGSFATPITNSWSPNGGLPMLFLNATDVHSGERAISSPMAKTNRDGLSTRITLNGSRDLTLGSAAVMSARFPFISPAGRILVGDQTIQLVDGGYFDNTGLATIHDVLAGIAADEAHNIEVIVLSIESQFCHADGTEQGEEICEDRDPKGLIGTPLSTVAAIRNGQEALLHRRFCDAWVSGTGMVNARVAEIFPGDFNFTLSWYLSQRSFDDIFKQTAQAVASPMELCS